VKVIGFTGYAQSGKDTAAGFLVDRGWKRLAFADILRQSLYNLNPIVYVTGVCDDGYWEDSDETRVKEIVDRDGWDVAKTRYPEIRQLLQRFGTEVGRELYGESFWVDRVLNQIKEGQPNDNYVITDVRFPNELAAVRDIGGAVFKIQRLCNKPANAHASEDIDGLRVDGVIPNTGTLDRFQEMVLEAAGLN